MKTYWSSIDDYKGLKPADAEEKHKESVWEFIEENGGKNTASRRDFLKLCGFTIATAAIASSCENPVNKAVPLLNRPEEMVPGKANYYAGSIIDGPDYCPVVVKVRDGRPIKIEGNEFSSFSKGGTLPRHQASVLSLYDSGARYKSPLKAGEEVSWEKADKEVMSLLQKAATANETTVLLSSSIISPSTLKAIEVFKAKYPNLRHVMYDTFSLAGMIQANQEVFGKEGLPTYRFDKADLIVSVNADFLGGWISPLEHIAMYSATRRPEADKPRMSRHIQIESWMSLSGANADLRHTIKPSEVNHLILGLHDYIAKKTGNTPSGSSSSPDKKYLQIADELLDAKGKSLLVCGSNDPNTQILVNAINHMLGNYGNTLFIDEVSMLRRGKDRELQELVKEMKAGKVSGLMIYGCNPLYDASQSLGFADAMNKLKWSLSFSYTLDETADACVWVCPDNHPLESWNDANPQPGIYSIAQPAIRPLFNTRQFQTSLLKWSEHPQEFDDFLKEYWQSGIFTLQNTSLLFEEFWIASLQKGVFEIARQPQEQPPASFSPFEMPKAKKTDGYELIVYESIIMGSGRQANNPWLLELPDPILKISWDNALLLSIATANELSISSGDIIEINGESYPVLIQAGMPDKVFAISGGYGRQKAGKAGNAIGHNAFAFLKFENGYLSYSTTISDFRKTTLKHEFAFTQRHNSMEGRTIVKETNLKAYKANHAAGNEDRKKLQEHLVSLYPPVSFPGHHWGLAIDLNACVGCNNCVVSCQAENNIPTVGKDQVKNTRIMHWIKVDRYFTGSPENPEVLFQPLMCQQCDNAPCENVCPVSATMHSDEGISQMAYNRCVGTRYCINNCPYKQRRFNWYQFSMNKKFDYHMNDDLGRLVLNPDVTVRERGVVEKCSFCVQRIQEAKMKAKLEGRQLRDGEIQPACVQSCPSKALVFGDLSEPESRVSKLMANERNYHLLEELHTLPSVGYLTKIRNRNEDEASV